MTEKERMLAGLPYRAYLGGLPQERLECRKKVKAFNDTDPDDQEGLERGIRAILGKAGPGIFVEPPFHCDYGWNIEVGENFYANFNLVILDVGKVTMGDNVFIAPNVAIYTAGHPIHPYSRNTLYEYGIPITIGDNVWIGGNVVITPGVTIGSNVVIGAGSVVTKDIPDWCVAAGNPCKVLHPVTEEDRKFYFKKRVFDVEI